MLVVLAAYQLLQLTKRDEPVFRQSNFWILIGIFSYFMCCSFIILHVLQLYLFIYDGKFQKPNLVFA